MNLPPCLRFPLWPCALLVAAAQSVTATEVTIRGEDFFIDGRPTYEGRTWQGARIEGLLLNSRMVQATFDDLNPETVGRWVYADIDDNGQSRPEQITKLIEKTRALPSFHPMLVLINEDDHFKFERPDCNFATAVRAHVSWGFFDFRMKGEGFDDGYQSVPVNWSISSPRKRAFFKLLAEITGSQP